MDFNIDFNTSVGPLFFGMSQQETIDALGEIDQTIFCNEIIELYCDRFFLLAQIEKKTDKLCEVGFTRHAKNVKIRNIDIFSAPSHQVVSELYNLDPTAKIGIGALVFPLLGISMTGFTDDDDNDNDAKAMTAFAKGYWDSVLPLMKPFKIR